MNLRNLKAELSRKAFHMLILLLPLLFFLSSKKVFLPILFILTAIVVATDFARLHFLEINQFWVKIFGKIMRDAEIKGEKLSGLSATMIAACLIFPFMKPVIAICAFVVLAISDSLAAIIGKAFPSKEFFEKSKNGSLAFFLSSVVILVIFGSFYDCPKSFYFFGVITCSFTTILEARPKLFGIDDNFLIPFSFASFASAFDLIWSL